MRPALQRVWTVAWQIVLALVYFHATMLYASVALAGILYLVVQALGASLAWWHWVALAPAIYVAWLNSFLIACAIEMRFWRPVTGYRKPRRATNSPGDPLWLAFFQTMGLYMRQRLVWSLPLAQAYVFVPGLRHLVWLSYSTRAKVGPQSVVLGCLYDPDLTEIADECIVGAGATICAHSFMRNPDGGAHLVTATVIIGDRAVVGGNARIDPGVRIGPDSIVEPCSYVTAFTTIGPGEVWGGSPARFIRMRQESARPQAGAAAPPAPRAGEAPRAGQAACPAIPAADIDDAEGRLLREIVALALDRPVEQVTDELSAEHCSAWDSLCQMSIAAGLQQRLGIMAPASESHKLRSLHDVRNLVRQSRAARQPPVG